MKKIKLAGPGHTREGGDRCIFCGIPAGPRYYSLEWDFYLHVGCLYNAVHEKSYDIDEFMLEDLQSEFKGLLKTEGVVRGCEHRTARSTIFQKLWCLITQFLKPKST